MCIVKSRLEGDGGEQKRKDELKTDRPTVLVNKPERKRFLGGERDPQEGGRNAPSGNYTRGGYYFFTNKLDSICLMIYRIEEKSERKNCLLFSPNFDYWKFLKITFLRRGGGIFSKIYS